MCLLLPLHLILCFLDIGFIVRDVLFIVKHGTIIHKSGRFPASLYIYLFSLFLAEVCYFYIYIFLLLVKIYLQRKRVLKGVFLEIN